MTFNVNFSEDVSNVDISDFTLVLTGTAAADPTLVLGNAGDADDSTYTITVNNISGDGTVGLDVNGATDIQDAAGNIANTTPTVDEVYTVGEAPRVTGISTADLDNDGYIDAVLINFSEAIQDSSVVANDWDVIGVTGESFSSTTNGDVADDDKIYITFADGVLDSGATPTVTYTRTIRPTPMSSTAPASSWPISIPATSGGTATGRTAPKSPSTTATAPRI